MKNLLFVFLFTASLSSFAQVANEEEIVSIMNRHNFWRADVGLPELKYSKELAKTANVWAKELKNQGCQFKHSKSPYGENLFKGTVGYYTAEDAVDAWGEEKADYNYEKNDCTPGKMCGHYTQIVWKNTTEVGCAKVICEGSVTWVCNYNPPGNYVNQKPY